MKEFNEELSKLHQQCARKKHLDTMLSDLYRQRDTLTKRADSLYAASMSEQEDVEQLEGRSLAALFYRLFGKMEEKLDKERQEAYEAAVKYDAVVRELEAVKADIGRYEAEQSSLNGCEERYERVKEQKAAAIRDSGSAAREELLKLEEQLAALTASRREIAEAIDEGRKARSIAEQIESQLDSASNWGTYDLLGGGLAADLAKHNHLNKAQRLVENLQIQLRRYKTELTDIAVTADIGISIDDFLRFADCFFDGLFADWAVMERISNAGRQTAQTLRKIEAVQQALINLQTETEEESARVKSALDTLILRAE
ncbi:MAG: hypothetical protein IJ493_13345 [Clostridia bacterium]|nr:hypothetical protein [Clostridia bacterium]